MSHYPTLWFGQLSTLDELQASKDNHQNQLMSRHIDNNDPTEIINQDTFTFNSISIISEITNKTKIIGKHIICSNLSLFICYV